ncbi:MAG: quinone oxidoreductase [Gammaproteobacteria bacterium]|nr:quinone oxidoreductase [Gammaproteobacteria bacterium]
MQTHAIRIHEFGGPDVLSWEDAAVPDPGAGEALIRHTAIGLNFIDVYHRTGLYPMQLPTGLGREAAGVIAATGPGVTDVGIGDRVVYTGGKLGSYAEVRTIAASGLVPIPDDIADDIAAAVFLKGLTAWYLLHHSYRVQPGDPILFYAAAGGVGSIATQWAKQLGATVIGVVSTPDKAKIAAANGCDHILMSDDSDMPDMVRALTGGAGVAAVYDSVGKDTFMTSLDCLRPHGTMVTFGNASGAVEPFAPAELAKRGSLYVTRPILEHFVPTREKLLAAATTLFAFIRDGKPNIRIGQTYALKDAAQAHRDLEARETTGSTILLP